MSSEARVTYWLKGQSVQNFGDSLSEVLFDVLTKKSLWHWRQGRLQRDYDVVHLIGSCISDWHIRKDLEYVRAVGGERIAFWGCGLREKRPLTPDLAARCVFLGVRGPLTRDVLGLPRTTPLGDPGLLLPHIYAPTVDPKFIGKTVCVPHFLEKRTDDDLLSLSGCDLTLRPNIPSGVASISAFTDSLASAKFVLAGSLHAAIIAYSIPYAYFDSDYIDCPFKWADFAASVNMRCEFARTLEAANAIFAKQPTQGQLPDLQQLLVCSPYRPPKSILTRAAASARRTSASGTPLSPTTNVGGLLAATLDGADFSYSPAPDTSTINPAARRIASCLVVFDEEGRNIVRLRGGAEDAVSAGATGGYAIHVPRDIARAAAGRTVRTSVLARAESGASGTRFAIAYSTNEVGNSSWHWFEATPEWTVFEMAYTVPTMAKGNNGAFIGLLPAVAGTAAIEICVVAIRVS